MNYGCNAMSISLSSRVLPLISLLSGLSCIQNGRSLQFFAWVGYLNTSLSAGACFSSFLLSEDTSLDSQTDLNLQIPK